MRIAIDIDGMLSSYPAFFQVTIPAWQAAGINVGILTAQKEENKAVFAEAFEKAGIKFDFLFFEPEEFTNFPNGVWKAVMCRVMKVDYLFDDMQHSDPTFVSDFIQVIDKTVLMTSFNYMRTLDGHENTIQTYVDQLTELLKEQAK